MENQNSPKSKEGRSSSLFQLPAVESRERIFRWFFFAAFAFLLYQLFLILSLFSDVIIWAVSLTLVFIPAHKFIQKRLPKRDNLTAALSTIGVLLLVLIPLLVLLGIVVEQSALLYPTVSNWISELRSTGNVSVLESLPEFLQQFWLQISALLLQFSDLTNFDPAGFLLANIDAVSLSLANFGTAVAGNILLGLLNLFLILILMFFCFRDGERLLHWLLEIVPMATEDVKSITLRIFQTVNAVIRGALFTAAVQGLLAMIGYLIAGVPLAIFFGVITGIAAMIPVVGAGLIWGPIALFVFAESPGFGIFVAVWGFFAVSMIDNFLKPIFIGSKARMPILLIFCSIIGGINIYGVTGVIIGPILVAVLLGFITIYREQYLTDWRQSGHAAKKPDPQ